MTKLLDHIFDSLPLTMLTVVGVCTVFMMLIILLLRPKGEALRIDPFDGAPPADKEGGQGGRQGRITRKKLPYNIMGVAFFFMVIGIAGLIACFNGIDLNRKVCFIMALSGFLGLFGYDFVANGAINRMNYFKIALKYFSIAVLVLSASTLLIVLLKLSKDMPLTKAWTAKGLAALAGAYLGGLGYFYGSRFHQNFDAIEIGSAFGFVPANSGLLSEDWIYDSKGVMNGVETLFNIEVTSRGGGRYSRTTYYHKLEVLCYCKNPSGICLRASAGWNGLLHWAAFVLRGPRLEKMPRPINWRGQGEFRSNMPHKVIDNLQSCKADTAVFGSGFKDLSLYKDELKMVFSRRDQAWSESEVKRILNSATQLAASFN